MRIPTEKERNKKKVREKDGRRTKKEKSSTVPANLKEHGNSNSKGGRARRKIRRHRKQGPRKKKQGQKQQYKTCGHIEDARQ